MRAALTQIRRRACFAGIHSMVGAFHVELFPGCPNWNVHVHAVLDFGGTDASPGAWEAEADRIFRSLTQQCGRFTIDPRAPDVAREDELRVSRYMFKPETYAPAPGAMDLAALDVLIDALHGRQLAVRWGVTGRGRRAATAPPVERSGSEVAPS